MARKILPKYTDLLENFIASDERKFEVDKLFPTLDKFVEEIDYKNVELDQRLKLDHVKFHAKYVIAFWPEYSITKFVGGGSYSNVWLGVDKSTQETVVIKQVKKLTADIKTDTREVKNLLYLSQDKNCGEYFTRIIDFFYPEQSGHYYIIMEDLLSRGFITNMLDWLNDHQSVDVFIDEIDDETKEKDLKNRTKIAKQLIVAVKYLHSLDMAHRDIKPDNIMINPETLDIKIIDFGFSCIGDNCRRNAYIGTLSYIPKAMRVSNSPVMFVLKDFQGQDIYGLGVVLFILFFSFMVETREYNGKMFDFRLYFRKIFTDYLLIDKEKTDFNGKNDLKYYKMSSYFFKHAPKLINLIFDMMEYNDIIGNLDEIFG